jgi:hypothetical protein
MSSISGNFLNWGADPNPPSKKTNQDRIVRAEKLMSSDLSSWAAFQETGGHRCANLTRRPRAETGWCGDAGSLRFVTDPVGLGIVTSRSAASSCSQAGPGGHQ